MSRFEIQKELLREKCENYQSNERVKNEAGYRDKKCKEDRESSAGERGEKLNPPQELRGR